MINWFLLAGIYHLRINVTDKQSWGTKMASSVLGRVRGSVLATAAREGIIKNGARKGEPYRIDAANVLVAEQNVTVVQLPRRDATGAFEKLGVRDIAKGEVVDFLVEFSIYGQDVQVRVLDFWPEEETASYLASA
jgi:hypothetical protein